MKRGLRPQVPGIHGLHYSATLGESNSIDVEPTDPYFPMQWYLKNTGQNGGKVRLDLNVQAAWAQGITGKNVTTAIMDDGRCNQCSQLETVTTACPLYLPLFCSLCIRSAWVVLAGVDYMHPDLKFNYVSN